MGLFDFFRKPKPRAIYSHADYNQIIDNSTIENIVIKKVEIGNVSLPSGHVIVCDPFAHPDMPPLAKAVGSGNYPVTLYFAQTEDFGERIAIAVISFQNIRANKFELALKSDEDLSELGEDNDFFGFPVEAGLASFMDLKVLEHYKKFLSEFYEKNPEANIYDDFFRNEFKKNSTKNGIDGDWINFKFIDEPEYNVVMFSSGYGDGVYPAYWGITNEGELANLIVDFHVLLLPEE